MAKKETPLMTQYNTIKAKYPDALLLFRVGDFYETFGTDAIKTSQILGIVLTKRANGEGHIELAGFIFCGISVCIAFIACGSAEIWMSVAGDFVPDFLFS